MHERDQQPSCRTSLVLLHRLLYALAYSSISGFDQLFFQRGLMLASSSATMWNATGRAEEGLARGTSPTDSPRPLQATG